MTQTDAHRKTPKSLLSLFTSQHNKHLDALLYRFVSVVHPSIYDCRDCAHEYDHCPQQLIQNGQNRQVWALFNGCIDSRANPELVFGGHPGDMFAPTSPGAMLTPYEVGEGTNSSWASIEFAISQGVRDLVQFGHTECGAMKGLVGFARGTDVKPPHLRQLLEDALDVDIAAEQRFVREHGRQPGNAELIRATEYENVRLGARRMRDFVDKYYPDMGICVHGWIYDVRGANILALQEDGSFAPITHMPQRIDYGALPESCEQGMWEISRRLVQVAHGCEHHAAIPANQAERTKEDAVPEVA